MEEDRYARYPSLREKVVVVTGGATGIGRAFVERFHEQGAHVYILDLNEKAGAALEAAAASKQPGSARFLRCDVTDTRALQDIVHGVAAEAGGIDVLVNNAADDTRHTPEEMTEALWDRCLAVNLKHQFFASQAAWPAMAARGGGSILCLGSIAWLNKTTGMIAYTTAKAAVHGLVRTLARHLGPKGIRVNAILPGWTMTDRQLVKWVDESAERQIAEAQCLPIRIMPDDVARMALFLAADDGAACTQQCFIVDGGWI
jgi:NAD(P)-dependent dehydrogenase (short-subunit alcohol dehydrogenase family)